MFGCHGNSKTPGFDQNFNENRQFFLVLQKTNLFYDVLLTYTERGTKATYSKDVLR